MKLSLILGHRGARFTAPENSIDSFKNALQCGADGIELDVHLTSDNKLVVIHDSDLRRITGNKIPIRNLSLSEIKSLDISHLVKSGDLSVHWHIKVYRLSDSEFFILITDKIGCKERKYFIEIDKGVVKSLRKARLYNKKYVGDLVAESNFSYKSGDRVFSNKYTRIPELHEVLENINSNFINIEIKRGESFYPGISEEVVKTIKPFGFNRFLISSFNRETLLGMKNKYPFLKINQLYEIPKNPVKAAEGLDGVNPLSILIGKKGIIRVHNAGKTVFPWVVNRPISIAKFILFGVDGIITDRPCFAVYLKNKIRRLVNEATK